MPGTSRFESLVARGIPGQDLVPHRGIDFVMPGADSRAQPRQDFAGVALHAFQASIDDTACKSPPAPMQRGYPCSRAITEQYGQTIGRHHHTNRFRHLGAGSVCGAFLVGAGIDHLRPVPLGEPCGFRGNRKLLLDEFAIRTHESRDVSRVRRQVQAVVRREAHAPRVARGGIGLYPGRRRPIGSNNRRPRHRLRPGQQRERPARL